ncbi:MAG: tRNA lysidine(34) synthetase TilS [Acidimicrobiales bacterium]|nr:tRNA lysidine(34) synthetase TilS [Acidimicrobiales bacterium]
MSGGPDSLALLVLAVEAGCEVTAVHVDHGLRPGSADEAEVVAAAARRFGAAFRAERVEVGTGPNLEARARAARRAVLGDRGATGHTADDQAETVLVNLLRGAGVDGLAGMRSGPPHPILALRRRETHDLCRALGLDPVRDPTNRDPRHVRNRVRHELLPLCSEIAGRDLVPVLARQASLLAGDAEILDAVAHLLDPTDARAVAGAPDPVARRAVRRWLAGPTGYPPDAEAVARVLEVAGGRRRATEVEGGRRIVRSSGRLSEVDADPPGCRGDG